LDLIPSHRLIRYKHIRDLTPTDLPALIEAERYRIEEYQEERERAEFVEVVHSDLERLEIVAGMS
jgi:hypothetical protein